MGSRGSDRGQAGPASCLRGRTSRRHLGGVDGQNPGGRVEEVRLGDGRRANPAHASGLARGFSATRLAPGGGRTGKSLAGGRLAGGGPRTLSLLLGPSPPTAHQSPLPETEPLPLAHRTILPALQGGLGFGPLRRPFLARLSSSSGAFRRGLPIYPDRLLTPQKKLLVRRGNRFSARSSPGW